MLEIWKDIPGYEGRYQVSSEGRIKNISAGEGIVTGRILKASTNLRGYLQIQLGKYAPRCTVHSLVMLAFVGPRPVDYDINHKDGVKANNRPDNLEYVTKSQNKRHSIDVLGKTRGESHANSKLTEEQVREIRRLVQQDDMSLRAIGRLFGVTHQNVRYIAARKGWTHVA